MFVVSQCSKSIAASFGRPIRLEKRWICDHVFYVCEPVNRNSCGALIIHQQLSTVSNFIKEVIKE